MTGVVDVKLPRVSSSPSVPKHKQGERGRDTPLVLAENGDASATSVALRGGKGGGAGGGGGTPLLSLTP